MAKKKCPDCPEGLPEWMATYSDMITLLLVFFVSMFSIEDASIPAEMELILASFDGLGDMAGGMSFQEGRLPNVGSSSSSLPSTTEGNYLDQSIKRAVSLFNPEIERRTIRIVQSERGLIISLASDAFFDPGSAEIKNTDENNATFQKLAALLRSDLVKENNFRIEGHTDNAPIDPNGVWESNWELSTQRANKTLYSLMDYGAEENRFMTAGAGSTRPLLKNDTPEGRSYNRRVDVIILTAGNL